VTAPGAALRDARPVHRDTPPTPSRSTGFKRSALGEPSATTPSSACTRCYCAPPTSRSLGGGRSETSARRPRRSRRAGGRRRARRRPQQAAHLPRRQPLHHVGIQVPPAGGGHEAAPTPVDRARARTGGGRVGAVASRPRNVSRRAGGGTELVHAGRDAIAEVLTPHQREVLVALTLKRRPDRRLGGAARHDTRRPLYDPARRPAQATGAAGERRACTRPGGRVGRPGH
jgi:hypothetical protein